MNQYKNMDPVSNETELRNAVTAAPSGVPTVIELAADITLTGSTLNIFAGKIITLTGNHSLTGASGENTIGVYGELTIDGITVTHMAGMTGIGVSVSSGKLTLESGAVAGNTASSGAGVHVIHGIFNMNGGEIYNNTASVFGAGVVNNLSTFNMAGGEIHNNTYTGGTNNGGGGVYNQGTMNMSGGKIRDNIARGTTTGNGDNGGGGVYAYRGSFTMSGGEISNNTVDYGGGGVTLALSVTFNMSGGVISGNTARYGGGIYVNQAQMPSVTFNMTGGEISGNTAPNGGGIYLKSNNTPLTIGGDAKIIGNIAGSDGGGIWVSYGDLSKLDVGPDVVFSGNTASRAFKRNPVDDPTYFAHIFATHWTTPFPQGYNNYDISYTNGTPFTFPTDVTLQATKSAVGAPLPDGRFTFGVFDENGNLIATAENIGGVIEFPQITYTETGVFNYTVRELTPSGDGWMTDGSVYPVTVTVTEEGDMLIATITYPDGQPTFVNTFGQPESLAVTVRAMKRLCGGCLCGGDFTFGLFDQNCNEVARTTNDVCGNIVFPKLIFTQAGVFCYAVRELNSPDCCGKTDTRAYPVIVTVTENGAGQLAANVRYPKGQPVFVNH